MLDAFELRGGVEEPDSRRSRDFSIILHKANIFSLCLARTDAIAVATIEVIILEIEYYITGSIADGDMLEVNSWN